MFATWRRTPGPMFSHLEVAAVREQARIVLANIPGATPTTRPMKGNPNWPTYQLADAVIKLCNFVEELRAATP